MFVLLPALLPVLLPALRPIHMHARAPAPALLLRTDVKVGEQIVAGNDWRSATPARGILRAQAYELRRVYFQGVVDSRVEKVDVGSLTVL